ncbi:MAG: TonB-dependent receptor [Ignavibacteriales bacterium]|nr:TonB-dependent receptor [Ignavibacteriales bacterium]
MHKKLMFIALLLALVLPLKQVVAQGTTTSASVVGTVLDAQGNPLPGATVMAVHKPSGTIFGTSTRADGKYTLQNVRVGGPYEISCSFVGFNKFEESVKYLALSQVLTLNIRLAETNMQLQEMTVLGTKDPILNSGRTGAATSVSKEQIEKLPTINRSFQDFSKLSPLFSGSSLSAGGRNSKLNNIQLDGTQYNDMFGLGTSGTPGGQANTNPISLDAIQEFQVVIAPFDVRQSGFTGGGINAITKSGTNTYEGSVYFYDRNQDFVGKSPNAAKKKYAEFSEYQTGFRVGGPIMQDKLFFFVNGELTKKKTPNSNAALSTANASVLQGYANQISTFLRDSLGYNPGTVDPYTANRPSQKLFFRFDYNLAENHNLTFRNNYVSADDDILQRYDRVSFDDRLYIFKNNTNSSVLQLTSTFGNQMANELIVGYTRIRDEREVDKAFPSLRIKTTVTGTDIYAGTEEFSIANRLDQDIFEITNNFSYYMGDHVMTAGIHFESFSFANLFIRNFYGNYTFNSVNDFLARKAASYSYRYSKTGEARFAPEFNAAQFGFYVQDEWSIMAGLKINAGLRFDIPTFPDAPAKNDSVAKYFGAQGLGTDVLPKSNILFSPRFGFNWDVFNDKTTMVRGGVGVFTGKIPYVWISNQYSNTGIEFADISKNNPKFFITDPNSQPKAGAIVNGDTVAAGGSTEINITDPDFKMPQVLRFNLGVDQKLPMNLTGTFDYMYSKSLNDVLYKDLNIGAPVSYLKDGRPVYTGSRIQSKYFQRVMYLTNTNEGYQSSISAQVQGEVLPGLNTNVAYALGTAKDYNSVTSSQAQSQFRYNPISGNPNDPKLTTSNFEIKHRILLSVSYDVEFIESYKTTFTVFYNGQSGRPFSYIYSNDANGDGHDQNDMIYVPANKDEYIYVASTPAAAATMADQFWAYVERDDYLKDHKGQIMERNAAREPWAQQWDFRVAQQIPIPSLTGQSLEISLDILNVANLLNSDWGWLKQVSNQSNALLSYSGVDATTGKSKVVFTNKQDPYVVNDLLSRFQMQLGLRYNF